MLLLDEISAALDSVSEAALHTALERVLKVFLRHILYTIVLVDSFSYPILESSG